MKLFNKISLFCIIYIYIGFILAFIHNKNHCENFKQFSKHYYSCYLDTEDESLLDFETIDVLIKYIDLNDDNLIRKGFPQLKKDIENGEIRYCIRSILQNIPWINKIYILMPNEKVKYLKEQNVIKDKIIYLKDKDVLGFDSASSITFEFNLWRLKNFGISNNFLYFNDDYFVGRPLKKKDFFYQLNGKVVPYILGQYTKYTKKNVLLKMKRYQNKLSNRTNYEQDYIENTLQSINSILFIYKLFGKRAKIRRHNHNAFGENLIDNEEIYNITLQYYHDPDACLNAIKRERNSMNYHFMHINYLLNRYKRKFKRMKTKYYDLKKNYGYYDLFVINKEGNKNYTYEDFGKSLIKMNKRFPFINKYEKRDIDDGIYKIENFFKSNMYINLNLTDNQLYLKENNDSLNEFEIKYQNDGTYTIKNIELGIYLGVSNIQVRDEFNILEKEYYFNFTKTFEGIKQKWYILSNRNDYYFLVSVDSSKCVLSLSNEIIKYNPEILCIFPNGSENQLFKLIKVYH